MTDPVNRYQTLLVLQHCRLWQTIITSIFDILFLLVLTSGQLFGHSGKQYQGRISIPQDGTAIPHFRNSTISFCRSKNIVIVSIAQKTPHLSSLNPPLLELWHCELLSLQFRLPWLRYGYTGLVLVQSSCWRPREKQYPDKTSIVQYILHWERPTIDSRRALESRQEYQMGCKSDCEHALSFFRSQSKIARETSPRKAAMWRGY